jgi:hypothetical protein
MDSKWITGRIVFLNTHILALMMNVYYSAFVVSSLLSAPTQSIHNTRDLIDSSLAFGAEDINYNRPFFEVRKRSPSPLKGVKLIDTLVWQININTHFVGRLNVCLRIFSHSTTGCLFGVRTPIEKKDFVFSKSVQTDRGAHPASCTMGIGDVAGNNAVRTWR